MEQIETFFNISEQTWLFLWSCVLGAVLGVYYDCFRVIRIIKKHNYFGVFIEDFFFIISSSLILFIYCTEKSRGEIRFFIFAGALIGFTVYILTIGNLVVNIIRKIVSFIYMLLNKIYKWTVRPICLFFIQKYQKSKPKIVNCVRTFTKSKSKNKNLLKESENMVYNNHKHKKAIHRGETSYGKRKNKIKKAT